MPALESLLERNQRIRPSALDMALAAALGLLGVIDLHFQPFDVGRGFHKHWSAYVFLGAVSLAVAMRRKKLLVAYPVWVLTVVTAILSRSIWVLLSSGVLNELVLVFSVAEQSPAAVAVAVLIAEFALDIAVVSVFFTGVGLPLQIMYEAVLLGLVWLAGRAARRRKLLINDLRTQARELHQEQEYLTTHAVAAERQRIAAELHTLVTQGVQQISVETTSARAYLWADPGRAQRAVERIETAGRRTLLAMGRLLALLDASRDDGSGPLEGVRASTGVIKGRLRARTTDLPRSRVVHFLAFVLIAVSMTVDFIGFRQAFHRELSSFHQKLWLSFAALMVVAMLFRRLAPLTVLTFIALLDFVLVLLLGWQWSPPTAIWSMFICAYTVASVRGIRPTLAAVLVGTLSWSPLVVHPPWYPPVFLLLFLSFAAIAGFSMQAAGKLMEKHHLQAQVLRDTREERLRLALDQERSRVARDLHDVVAHAVTIMVVQAGAARLVIATDPLRADENLGRVQAMTAEAQRELASLEGSLGSNPPVSVSSRPSPGVESIPLLIEQEQGAGMDIDFEMVGQPPPLDSAAEISLYRIVQEALTNVRKHAPGARTRVVLRYEQETAEVEVTNTAPLNPTTGAASGFGRGLIGVRERAAMFGGEASAGDTPDGGFTVSVHLPLELVPT